jgi:hypothetical protein
MGRKRTAEESEILVGGCKDNKQMEQPAETSVEPYGRAVRNVFLWRRTCLVWKNGRLVRHTKNCI